ncbi:hypothetical protein T459_29089 [Capsicum annuum]|uniref:F-box associated beta-propeller type 3 domain-containing protein n=1 Tax=Capsicum annuum TaxID=4072 RepID=A0A2G2Y4L0_CAPAN|nr:hypothetical protein T459_29089 [Capsicum annuum]
MYCCPLSPVQLVEDVEKLKLDCPSNPKPSHCAIHCCYDGLAIIEVSVFLDRDNFTHLLWNPSTRESIVLPPTECPLVSLSRFGLGYDSINGEYKILHICQDLRSKEIAIEILALKGGSWRRIDPRGICNVLVAIQFFIFVHAAFHWVTISSNYFEVVSFNISNEVYGEIPLSEEILSLRSDSRDWALKEYGVKGSWMLLLTVEEPNWSLNAKPTYLFADAEVLFWCMSYQHIGHTFRTLNGPFRSWPICDTMQVGSAFTESLISPKSLTY